MRCQNKRVFITGASSGIGFACAESFAKEGASLLLCARSGEKLTTIARQINDQYQVEVYPLVLDVSDAAQVQQKLADLPMEWQAVDVLVNNAGLALGIEKIHEGDVRDWEQMIDTNIKGVLYILRHMVAKMVERGKGHIINIGSISAYQVYSGGVVYCATKFALRAISEGLKMDLHGTPIRVSSVDPGMVDTHFSMTRFKGDRAKANAMYQGMTPLNAEDIADAVVYCATRPAHVDVREIKIYPTDQTATHMCYRHSD